MNRTIALWLAGSLAGCLPARDATPDAAASTDADIAQYDQMQAQLAQNRSVLLGPDVGAAQLSAQGNQLFYLVFPALSPTVPTLSRYDDGSGVTVHYGFSIGTTDASTPYNYAMSGALVATIDASQNLLSAYQAASADQAAGSLVLPEPPDGQLFAAYAVDGNDVYYVDETSDPVLMRWTPGAEGSATAVLTFSQIGVDARGLQNFDVSGNQLVLVDLPGEVWLVDLATPSATPLQNAEAACGAVWSSAQGLLFGTGASCAGLSYYDFATGQTTDVAGGIAASGYQLDATYAQIHEYKQDGALGAGVVYYIGQGDGLYAFDLAARTVRPLLLAPRDGSLVYRSPQPLDDGTLVVLGVDALDPGGPPTVYRVAH
ncbi:MAG: hypothetical protein ACYDCL_17780 [Myxococcales bacterium]